MGKKTLSFVTEIPLKVHEHQEPVLLRRLDVARQVYNAFLGESLRRLDLMRESREYQAGRELPKGDPNSKDPASRKRAEVRKQAFKEVRDRFGFSEYALYETFEKKMSHSWIGEHLDAHTIQSVRKRAFNAATQYAYGRRGKPRFKGKNQFDSVEGKTNDSGLRWIEDRVVWSSGNPRRHVIELQALIKRDENGEPIDPVIRHGLNSHIKYVRLVRRKINGKNRFYAQLVNRGKPLPKSAKTEGYKIGCGDVGLDLGPSTIAVVAPQANKAHLRMFCPELKDASREIRRLQRKMDRQRRANNPENYNQDGTIKRGVKFVWKDSRGYLATRHQKNEIERKLAAHRKSLHGREINEIFALGDVVYTEKLSYQAFQRRFGKSVGKRAPGMFMEMMRRKAASAGVKIHEFPTYSTRFSQLCHQCGSLNKKPLCRRWHKCDCGVSAQRDLYSAFLASCAIPVKSRDAKGKTAWIWKLDAPLALARWPGAELLLRSAFNVTKQSAMGGHLPASFGINRSQSGSTKKLKTASRKDQDDVLTPLGRGEGLVKRPAVRACRL